MLRGACNARGGRRLCLWWWVTVAVKPLGDGDLLEEAHHWKQDLSVCGITPLPFHSLTCDFI